MKKIIILSIALLAALSASAQMKTTDYNYSSFKGISVDDDFVVTVMPGSDYQITVQAESQYMQYVTVGVSAGVLEIALDERSVPSEIKRLFKGSNPQFKATIVTPDPLRNIKLKGKSVVTINGELSSSDRVSIFVGDNAVLKPVKVTAPSCEIELEKKGTADVDYTGDKVTVDASGNSSLNLTRESNESDIQLSGSSNLVMRGSSKTLSISSKGTSKSAINGSADKVQFTLGGTSNINAVGLDVKEAKVDMSGLCSLTEAARNKLTINISGGASLVFDGKPEIEIENIKNASVSHYSK